MPVPPPPLSTPSRAGILLRPLAPSGAAAAIYLVAATWCLRSALGHWNTAYVGGTELPGWLWRYWWMKQLVADAWTHGSAPYAAYIALVSGSYPETGNVFDLQVFSLPLETVFGAPAYYNWKALLFLVGNGLAGYGLARETVGEWWASVLCGLAFGFSGYVLLEIDQGRIRHAGVFPLALYALALVRASRPHAPLRDFVLGGAALGLCVSMYFFYGFCAVFLTVIALIWLATPPADAPLRQRLACAAILLGYTLILGLAMAYGNTTSVYALALAGGAALVGTLAWQEGLPRVLRFLIMLLVGLLIAAPSATFYIREACLGRPLPDVTWHRDFPPLDAIMQPPRTDALQDPFYRSLPRFRGDSPSWDYPFRREYRRAVPLVFTILALGGLALFRRRPWMWVGVTLVGYILSLGPYLKAGEQEQYVLQVGSHAFAQGIPLPYTLCFKYIPAFSRLFSPIRLEALFLLGLGVLVAWSASRLFEGLRVPPWVRAALCVVAVGLAAEQVTRTHQAPPGLTHAAAPDAYTWLAVQPQAGIVELPYREASDSVNYYQTLHHRKVLGEWAQAPLDFPDSPTLRLVSHAATDLPGNDLVSWLHELNSGQPPPVRPTTRAIDDFHAAGYRYVLAHERGCCFIRRGRQQGQELYQHMKHQLETQFGTPARIATEPTRECAEGGTWQGGSPPLPYEIAVYDTAAQKPAPPRPSPAQPGSTNAGQEEGASAPTPP